MHIEGLTAVAMVPAGKPGAVIATIWGLEALSVAIGVVVVARMLAKTLKVLGSDYKKGHLRKVYLQTGM